MATKKSPKRCIAEGPDTSSALLGLVRSQLQNWLDKESADVWVVADHKIQNSLKPAQMEAEWKASDRTHLAYVIDAEDDAVGRWNSIRAFSIGKFNQIPNILPQDGLVLTDQAGRKFGAWVMPDNQSAGMLEDYLSKLVPPAANSLWQHAVDSVTKARQQHGAPCKDVHLPKAHIRTWLGFLDPPGQGFGPAIAAGDLDASHVAATTFIDWFRRMFDV